MNGYYILALVVTLLVGFHVWYQWRISATAKRPEIVFAVRWWKGHCRCSWRANSAERFEVALSRALARYYLQHKYYPTLKVDNGTAAGILAQAMHYTGASFRQPNFTVAMFVYPGSVSVKVPDDSDLHLLWALDTDGEVVTWGDGILTV